jgi:hypothetical protein
MSALTARDREELQAFLRDWLRHSGRTQADLRRALRVPSSRMPVILDALEDLLGREGVEGLAGALCGVEEQWKQDQLDLLLDEIRRESDG